MPLLLFLDTSNLPSYVLLCLMLKIWSRLPREQVPRSLRITDGETHAGVATAAAAAFIARKAAATNIEIWATDMPMDEA